MRKMSKIVGLAITCFGLGILLTFFLPIQALIIIEALVIITAGFIFIKC
ncbi:hypothetical protein FACS1894105_04460 [Clostridia bacterium]|nr:hypothetical protein FACS1894105_04460 [Clostridia bacterium]